MKTVVIEGKDLLFTLFKLAFYIWIGMWNVRILLVAVKMVIAVGVYSTYFAVILVSVYGIYSAFRGFKKTVAKTIALMDDYFKETGDAMEDYSFRVGFGYVKVIVQHNFRDKENDLVLRTAGEELEVPRKRAEYLANLQLVKIVKAQKGGDPKSPIEAED